MRRALAVVLGSKLAKGLGLATAAGLTLALGACESAPKGPVVLTPEERAAQVPAQAEAWNKLGYRVQWRGFATLLPGETVANFQALDDVLVTQGSMSGVTVTEVNSGQRRWSDQVGSPLIRFYTAQRDGKRLIVPSEAEVYFFDIETGSLVDKQPLAEVASTAPAQAGDILVFGTTSNVVLGHNKRNGYRAWGVLMNAPTETAPVMLADTGVVGMVSRRGDIAFANAATGTSVGRAQIFDGTTVPVASSESAMFIASRDFSLYGYSNEGTQLWRIRTEAELRWAPTYHDKRVYCDLGGDGLTCVDAATGKIVWNNAGVAGRVIAVSKGRLLTFDGSSAALVDPKDGSVVQRVLLDEVRFLVPDKFVDGTLYAVSSNGVISKLTLRP